MSRRASTLSNARVVSEQEVQQVQIKYLEDIEFTYEEALQKHVSKLKLTEALA